MYYGGGMICCSSDFLFSLRDIFYSSLFLFSLGHEWLWDEKLESDRARDIRGCYDGFGIGGVVSCKWDM